MKRQRYLYVMRHGQAQPGEASGDFSRPLTKQGQEHIRQQARALSDMPMFRPDCILCSTAQRTRQTAAILKTVFTGVPVFYRETLYLAPAFRILEMLRETDDIFRRILIIGHNPGLEHLIAVLTKPEMRCSLIAGACVFLEINVSDWQRLSTGTARLISHLSDR